VVAAATMEQLVIRPGRLAVPDRVALLVALQLGTQAATVHLLARTRPVVRVAAVQISTRLTVMQAAVAGLVQIPLMKQQPIPAALEVFMGALVEAVVMRAALVRM